LISGWNLEKYDGTNFTNITDGFRDQYKGIAWKPDGSYALIVGVSDPDGPSAYGTVLKYDGTNFTDISGGLPSLEWFEAVAWKP